MSTATGPAPSSEGARAGTHASVQDILPMMRCPSCRAELRARDAVLACEAGHEFKVQDGIPLLAVYGSHETWDNAKPDETSVDYQQQYQDLVAATRYNEAYRDKMLKRWSTQREFTLLDELLGSQPHCETLLNIPAGGGRLSEKIAGAADVLVEADAAFGQLLYGREHCADPSRRFWMTASAFHIPFKDASVDAVVSIRLCHHLPTAAERERLVSELLRVARRYVIMTYFDHHSVKNYLRRARAPFNKKPPKMTMTRARVAELAEQHGARVVRDPMLAWQSSGHRYALMVKG